MAPPDAGAPDPLPDTTTLVCRAREGDAVAFGRLAAAHGPALGRFCRRLTAEPSAAQDLAQETLLRAFESLPRLESPERFGAWLFGIAANLARWWWRRQARWPLSLDALAAAYPDVPWTDVPWTGSPGALAGAPAPEAALEEAEQTRRLLAAVDSLPPAMGRVVVLHYLDGLSYAEVAAALDVPVSTVKGRLFKSRTRLRRALDPQGLVPQQPRRVRQAHRKERPAMAADTPPAGGADERLVPVVVESIRTVPDKAPRTVVLKDTGAERYLPIQIGPPEAELIAMHLQGRQPARPMSPDLMASLLEAGGLQVTRVAVSRLEGETFYATVSLRTPGGETAEVDARPSDAINLALRTGAPLLVAEPVFRAAVASPDEIPPPRPAT